MIICPFCEGVTKKDVCWFCDGEVELTEIQFHAIRAIKSRNMLEAKESLRSYINKLIELGSKQ